MMKHDDNRKTAIRIGMAVSALVIVVGIAGIVSYVVQGNRAKQTAQEIREAANGNSEQSVDNSQLSDQDSLQAGEKTDIPESTAAPEMTPVAEEERAAAADEQLLPPVEYPDGHR